MRFFGNVASQQSDWLEQQTKGLCCLVEAIKSA